jgi:acetolactate synthase-1/2/3 large subunit
VLALTGQIQQAMIGRNVGLLHELPDQLAIMRGLTKWADRHPLARGGAGAGERGLPPPALGPPAGRWRSNARMDTWARRAPVELIEHGRPHADPCPVDEEAVERAAELLGSALSGR